MAGGRGLRLHPLTEHCPKPMLHVGGKPIIQSILEKMVSSGVSDVVIILHYKADLIRRYFGDGQNFGCRIEYLVEDSPQGTAGSLRDLGSFAGSGAILSNADVVADVDYRDLITKHKNGGNALTVVSALWHQQLPYGVVSYTQGILTAIREKPIHSFAVNSGVYAISKEASDLIPDRPFDMDELIGSLLSSRPASVGVYELEGFWSDVGTFEDLSRATTR